MQEIRSSGSLSPCQPQGSHQIPDTQGPNLGHLWYLTAPGAPIPHAERWYPTQPSYETTLQLYSPAACSCTCSPADSRRHLQNLPMVWNVEHWLHQRWITIHRWYSLTYINGTHLPTAAAPAGLQKQSCCCSPFTH